MTTRKILKILKTHREKNEHTGQCMHVQNHVYVNKIRHIYICTQCSPIDESCMSDHE